MKRIFKFVLDIDDKQELKIPIGSRILSVDEQNGLIVLYALVDDTEAISEKYTIIIHGTGHPANDVDDFNFIGTVKLENGKLMFHVFYKLEN